VSPDDLGDSPVVIDTDVFSLVVSQHGPYRWYEPYLSGRLWVLSFATVAELRYGAGKAGWGAKRREELERRIGLCVVLPGNNAVARNWAELNQRFASQIGINDLWIAATALAQSPTLPLLTNDQTLDAVGSSFGLTVVRKP